MGKKVKKTSVPPLEAHLIGALRTIDKQIARSMQRDENVHSVQKWGPLDERIELICSLLLERCGKQEVQLDSLVVLSQALVKSLRLLVEELDREGLGEVRTHYCKETFEKISDDSRKALDILSDQTILM